MMSIRIAAAERPLLDGSVDGWIREQFGRHQADRVRICVLVRIECGDANVHLATQACPASRGGGRRPNACEREILDLWNNLRLNEEEIEANWLIAFVRRVRECQAIRRAA